VAVTTHEVVLPLFDMASRPVKRYRTLVADPPWAAVLRPPMRFDGVDNGKNNYSTMTDAELMSMPIGLWAEDNAHLYLWCLNSNILQAHKVVNAWGFEVKTVITWVKGRIEQNKLVQHIGLGHYFRNSTEHVLFAVRGSLPTLNNDIPTALVAPRRDHSEKPSAFYDMVLRTSPGPYLDVFARVQRFEFDTWGNESFDFRQHGIWNNESRS
jgi:N6-adenosine-specific RNA methylase IME4